MSVTVKSKKLVIIGGEGTGGHIASCIEDNRRRNNDYEWEVVGFINDFDTEVCGYPVIGKLSDIPKFINETDYYFSWAIYLVGRNPLTAKMFEEAAIPESRLATVIHHSAFLGINVKVGPGTFIMHGAHIQQNAVIGKCALIKVNSVVCHNCEVGDLSEINNGAILAGYSKVGYCSHLAISSTVLAQKTIGDFALVGAGSVVTHDVPSKEVWIGSPAKFLKNIRED